MHYENRLPDEGINTTRIHPLRQFFQLATGAIILLVMLVVVLQFTGASLARTIPFSFEQKVMDRLDIDFGDSNTDQALINYLNDLARRLSEKMPFPEGMNVRVHYDASDVFNAFATVGGRVLFYKGLLDSMPSENTLAMVMAHEISHVLHRDPIAGLGGGVASTIAILALTGNAGTGVAGDVLSNAGMLTGMQFTRKMEIAADYQALSAVNALYGHVNGATTLFELFSEQRERERVSTEWFERFLSTHPLDGDRIAAIRARAASEEWLQQGTLTPLPDAFKAWL